MDCLFIYLFWHYDFSIAIGLTLSPEYTGTHWYTPECVGVFNNSSEFSGVMMTRRHEACLY